MVQGIQLEANEVETEEESIFKDIKIVEGDNPPLISIVEITKQGQVQLEFSQKLYFMDKLGSYLEKSALKISLETDYAVYEPEKNLLGFSIYNIEEKKIFLSLNLT